MALRDGEHMRKAVIADRFEAAMNALRSGS
jgi:hypothetical protein